MITYKIVHFSRVVILVRTYDISSVFLVGSNPVLNDFSTYAYSSQFLLNIFVRADSCDNVVKE